MSSSNKFLFFFIFFVIAVGLMRVARDVAHEQQLQREHYCEMIGVWHQNEDVAPEKRPGWPPYKGECDE